ncbi:MAG: glycosyltransferase [Lachnospiraceae bacterium]|nr:glycosyltransferase [Lachnospiraceae bacterium]
MKRVAVLVQSLNNGGAERMAANLSLELARHYRVYLIVFDAERIIYPYGGRLIDLKVPPLAEGSAARRVMNTLTRVRRLRYIKKKLGIDVTISHMEGANLVNILSRMNDRILCVYHSMPSMCESGSFANRLLHRFIGNGADSYLTVSKLAEADMHESFGVDDKKLSCIYNFCDLEKIRSWKEKELPKEAQAFYAAHPHMIISVGRLTHMKAHDRLLRMLSVLRKDDPEAGLVVLGEGEEREALQKLADELGLASHFYLPGEVENPFPYLKRARVFALISDFEGLPMVLIEAAACALPIVSVDIPSGPREILAPNTDQRERTKETVECSCGLLCPPCADEERRGELGEKEAMFAEALKRLLRDEELHKRLRERSAECAQRFSAERIVSQWQEIIEQKK